MQLQMDQFNENDVRRIFHFHHPFHYGSPLFGAPFLGGVMGGMYGSPFLSPYGYGYHHYGYGYPYY
ncbi:hypothetical protein [Neobacillus drentensis]|uniref:hypothetical protein n=1 Tax=Neobacillus drentensis TaxID=220684 RepID=UPI003001E90D